jgi:hypothetical protein
MNLYGRMGWDYGRIFGGVRGKISSHTRFKGGTGSRVRFWDDLWCGDKALNRKPF